MSTPETPGGPQARTGGPAAATPSDDGRTMLLEARQIVAGYVPGVNILDGTDLELHDGELVGIIGPNGAGKSTLIKALFGLIPVRSGTVVYAGDDVTGLKAHELVARGIGYVPQSDSVFPRLTVEENLEMGLYQRAKWFPERFDVVTTMFPRLGERR
jgi:branched-chain amino acid transport system ATP-binding protein